VKTQRMHPPCSHQYHASAHILSRTQILSEEDLHAEWGVAGRTLLVSALRVFCFLVVMDTQCLVVQHCYVRYAATQRISFLSVRMCLPAKGCSGFSGRLHPAARTSETRVYVMI
jgi:hypothetical protein